MSKQQKTDEKKRLLRLTKDLDDKLQKRAIKNKRSVNSQIVFELDQK